jgi:hypothetical protein
MNNLTDSMPAFPAKPAQRAPSEALAVDETVGSAKLTSIGQQRAFAAQTQRDLALSGLIANRPSLARIRCKSLELPRVPGVRKTPQSLLLSGKSRLDSWRAEVRLHRRDLCVRSHHERQTEPLPRDGPARRP